MVQLCESVCLMGGYGGKVGLLSKSSNLYLPLGFPLLLPPFTSSFYFSSFLLVLKPCVASLNPVGKRVPRGFLYHPP